MCLLMADIEPLKPSNTGWLIADVVADTYAFGWARTEVHPDLLALLADPQWQPYVVFPGEFVAPERVVTQVATAEGKRPLFVLLDATWPEARKMFRKSPYLNHLPVLSLQPEQLSRYHLRRSTRMDHFCTSEVGALCLELAGEPFTLVGRVQFAYADGRWTEWHALFTSGDGGARSGWLSEDNGAYVLSFDRPLKDRVPQVATLFPGQKALIDGRAWDVASVTTTHVHAAEGELPRPPQAAGTTAAAEFVIADLRNDHDEVGTLDYADPAQPQWSVGRAVRLAELKLAGLRDGASEKKLAGRSIECPSCGASLEIRLGSTQSVTCGQCKSVVDVSQGVGADLAHFQQNAVTEPQIPLGTVGTLKLGALPPLPWQVVGYLERCDLPAPGDDDEQSFWREYLLFHPTEGFVFLVDS